MIAIDSDNLPCSLNWKILQKQFENIVKRIPCTFHRWDIWPIALLNVHRHIHQLRYLHSPLSSECKLDNEPQRTVTVPRVIRVSGVGKQNYIVCDLINYSRVGGVCVGGGEGNLLSRYQMSDITQTLKYTLYNLSRQTPRFENLQLLNKHSHRLR